MSKPMADPPVRISIDPDAMPGLVAFWDFQEAAGDRVSRLGERYRLREGAGAVERIEIEGNPWGPYGALLKEGQYFVCPRAACPLLDVHGPGEAVTVVAWLKRQRKSYRECEFVAGQWNETNLGRQYGLFIDIVVFAQKDKVSAHVSTCGGPTPGFRYCMDVANSVSPVAFDEWACIAMTYDGIQTGAWIDGHLEPQLTVNPYALPGGLHDGGADGSDFTVGAVHRGGEMGNFFTGVLGGLAVYRRTLSPAEMQALARPKIDD
ncbi:MAG: LamG-like jellyroll fold domain-containing protein [Phycisphaeraceae bacterium]